MQETQRPDASFLREYFSAEEQESRMDKRLAQLQGAGHTLIRRIKIGRNDPCPCQSGKKFKKCCIDLIDTTK